MHSDPHPTCQTGESVLHVFQPQRQYHIIIKFQKIADWTFRGELSIWGLTLTYETCRHAFILVQNGRYHLFWNYLWREDNDTPCSFLRHYVIQLAGSELEFPFSFFLNSVICAMISIHNYFLRAKSMKITTIVFINN